MQKIELICQENIKLIDFLLNNINTSKGAILSALKEKDISVNGEKIKEEKSLISGDKITIYLSEKQIKSYFEIIYQDDNVVLVNKGKKIEVCDGEKNLLNILKNQFKEIYAVHRIDRNTEGLVIFALNLRAKNCLDDAIKNNKINKYYLTEVLGKMPKNNDIIYGYLLKDAKQSLVKIFDEKIGGSDRIKTRYQVLKTKDKTSILSVELLTGKTHQIRAHLAHIGHPVIGDGKYGDYKANKEFKLTSQRLVAYKLSFQFDDGDFLYYLNDKVFELPQTF